MKNQASRGVEGTSQDQRGLGHAHSVPGFEEPTEAEPTARGAASVPETELGPREAGGLTEKESVAGSTILSASGGRQGSYTAQRLLETQQKQFRRRPHPHAPPARERWRVRGFSRVLHLKQCLEQRGRSLDLQGAMSSAQVLHLPDLTPEPRGVKLTRSASGALVHQGGTWGRTAGHGCRGRGNRHRKVERKWTSAAVRGSLQPDTGVRPARTCTQLHAHVCACAHMCTCVHSSPPPTSAHSHLHTPAGKRTAHTHPYTHACRHAHPLTSVCTRTPV